MKIVIDANDLVPYEVALRMALQVLGREPGTYRFTHGFAVEVRETKTQRTFSILKRSDDDEN